MTRRYTYRNKNEIQFMGKKKDLTVAVTKENIQPLLGMDWIKELNLKLNSPFIQIETPKKLSENYKPLTSLYQNERPYSRRNTTNYSN